MVEDGVSPLMNAIGKCAELAANEIRDLKADNAKLRAEVEALKDDKAMMTGQLQQSRKHVTDADLQIDAEKKLYASNDSYLRDQLKEKDQLNDELRKYARNLIYAIECDHHLTPGGKRLDGHEACGVCTVIERYPEKRKCQWCGGTDSHASMCRNYDRKGESDAT